MQEIIIIAAIAENGTIGKNNAMPWSIKEDMAHFVRLTKGWPCIMGRKTWESLFQKPLPGRLNVIVSRSMKPEARENIITVPSLPRAMEQCAGYEKVFVIGGREIYSQALPLATNLELTMLRKPYEGDTKFPEVDFSQWEKTKSEDFDDFSFVSYARSKAINKN
jgi:dihydrofolate reductase